MEGVTINDLRKNKTFIEHIRWDLTPQIIFEPRVYASDNNKTARNIDGYMLYVDIVYNRPALVVMRNRESISSTICYVEDIPEELLKDAMHCSTEKCVAGMYPITKELEHWLKKELGL